MWIERSFCLVWESEIGNQIARSCRFLLAVMNFRSLALILLFSLFGMFCSNFSSIGVVSKASKITGGFWLELDVKVFHVRTLTLTAGVCTWLLCASFIVSDEEVPTIEIQAYF